MLVAKVGDGGVLVVDLTPLRRCSIISMIKKVRDRFFSSYFSVLEYHFEKAFQQELESGIADFVL